MKREAECTFGQTKKTWGFLGEEESTVCLSAENIRVGLWYGVAVGTGGMFKLGLSHRSDFESMKSHSHMAVQITQQETPPHTPPTTPYRK